MQVVLSILPFALCGTFFNVTLGAQTESRPAIFAERDAIPASPPAIPRQTALSDRVRTLVGSASQRVLADAKSFVAPRDEAATDEPVVMTSSGTVQMPRYVVKSRVLRREAVEPDLPLLQFDPIDRDDRRMIGGVSTRLLRLLDGRGEVNLNVVQAVGKGIDHGRDFTRAEIEFRYRW